MSAIRLARVASVSVWFRSKESFRFWPREKWNESQKMKEGGGEGGRKVSFPPHLLPDLFLAPFLARSLTLVPRSLLLNRTETLGTVGYDSTPKIPSWWRTLVLNLVNEHWLVDARDVPGGEVRGQTAVFAGYDCEGEFQIYSRPIRVNWNEYVWTGENDSKTIRYVWARFF